MKGFIYSLSNGLVCAGLLTALYLGAGLAPAVLLGLSMIYGEAACARANTTSIGRADRQGRDKP